MSNAFTELSEKKLNTEIASLLTPRIEAILCDRGPGHCMRITDIDNEIMESVCVELRNRKPDSNVFILGSHLEEKDPYRITSTKLVELRNPEADGALRQPLLVFMPTSLRTSAEDSFGVATFEELTFTNIYEELIATLIEQIPTTLVSCVRDFLGMLAQDGWPYADDVAKVRYLLAAIENGIDGETLGASLYELSLVPDFKLFEDPSRTNWRIHRNLESIRQLVKSDKSVRGRISELGLSDKALGNSLFMFFEQFDVQEPEIWTRRIALEERWWPISFDKWAFREETVLDKILISSVETDLPAVAEDDSDGELSGLVGQQVLIPSERRKLNIVFEVNPHPTKVNGLSHFTVQILSQEGAPIGKSKKVGIWKQRRTQCTVSLTNLNKIDFEEGWHFIRVLPWTAEGDPIPFADDSAFDSSLSRPCESEPFYVIPHGSLEEEPPQRAVPIEKSLEHARLRLQLTALGDDRNPADIKLTSVAWVRGGRARRSSRQETIIAKFGRDGAIQIPLSRILATIEQRILQEPDHPAGWRMQINMDSAEPPTEIALSLPSTTAMQSFLAARADFFSAIQQGSSQLVIQGFSLLDSEAKCVGYAEAFLDLVKSLTRKAQTSFGAERQSLLLALRNILAVDSVHLVLTDFRGTLKEAVLVSPTHPLRVLWLLAWTQLGQTWISRTLRGGKEHIAAMRTALLETLQPSAFPVGIPVEDGRIFIPVDNLGPFWGLYAPTTEENTRGLMAETCSALGIHETVTEGSSIPGHMLAERIERYLSQHPYLRELSVNIFNPGSGAVLADALIALQKKREYADLRYDIRLFSSDPESQAFGEALESMLRPDTSVDDAADAFAASAGSHLFPKLSLAKHSSDEFHLNAQEFTAHLSILLDVFPAEEISIGEKDQGLVPLHGLIQDYRTDFVDDANGTYWHKHPIIGAGVHSPEQTNCFDLLTRLTRDICVATSSVATSGASFTAVPVVTLGLDVSQREFMYLVHSVSDWVFTIDRHMGIEFFDHGGQGERPDYLIDFLPSSSSQATHNLIVSSRSMDELQAMLSPVMERHGLAVDAAQSVQILAHLRSLSGQLALKLISAPRQQTEALGLALARLFLDYQGALSNQIIVPLDAHIDLYRTPREAADIDDAVSLRRTDLALFDLDQGRRVITCNLVEVKCYSQVGDFSAFNQLKERVSAQISQSERILQRHFDPALKTPDRPDRALKSRELAQILRFYLERSVRYGIFNTDAAKEASALLESLEYGYSLQFRRCALVFDFDKDGSEGPEIEVGIEFHRIGKNLIRALLDGCRTQGITDESEKFGTASQSFSEQFIPEVPKLESSAFIVPKRERITTCTIDINRWEQDAADSVEGSTTICATAGDLVGATGESNEEPAPGVTKGLEGVIKVETNAAPESQPSGPQHYDTDSSLGEGTVAMPPCGENETHATVPYDVLLGVSDASPQYGVLGEVSGRKIALDLNHTHTMSLFGVQGGGKSYTLGTVIEMASMSIRNVNVLPSPLACVIFHYSPTQDYAPEFTSMIHPNAVEGEVKTLQERYGAIAQPLQDLLILTPSDKVDERLKEYPEIEVRPIAFSSSELKTAHWKFLMGAVGSQSMYMRQINLIMRSLRNNLTLDGLRSGIEKSGLSDHLTDLALTRLQFASQYIDDSRRLQELVRPGRLLIVDLRDEYIEKDEAFGLFVVMLQIFSEATLKGKAFNKLVVFDEAHKYIENDDLVSGLIEAVREMRHKGTSIMVASQDPPSVPVSLIELSSQIIMHKFNSPAWLKHIQKANSALGGLTSDKMSRLGTGEAYIWSSKASDDSFTRGAVKIKCRPRVTQHGGSTKTAVSNDRRKK